MAFSEVGSVYEGSNSDLVTVTHGLTIGSGDLVVFYMNCNSTPTVTPVTGTGASWTEEISDDPTSESARQVLFSKIANSSEPSAFTATLSGSDRWGAVVKVFSSTTTGEVDAAANATRLSGSVTYLNCAAANGEVISDDAVSCIFGGKDTAGAAQAYTAADNSYTGVVGDVDDQVAAGAHRIYTTGETFSGNIRIDTADANDDISDAVYSVHISFVESAAVALIGENTIHSFAVERAANY